MEKNAEQMAKRTNKYIIKIPTDRIININNA